MLAGMVDEGHYLGRVGTTARGGTTGAAATMRAAERAVGSMLQHGDVRSTIRDICTLYSVQKQPRNVYFWSQISLILTLHYPREDYLIGQFGPPRTPSITTSARSGGLR